MSLFKSILLPIDLSSDTEVSVKKAIELIEEENAEIHLLHIIKPSSKWSLSSEQGIYLEDYQRSENYNKEIELKLNEWQSSIEETVQGVTVEKHIMIGGAIQDNIITVALRLCPSLIIISDHEKHNLFSFINPVSATQISKAANCTVLKVKPDTIHTKIKSIVVPVRNAVTDHTMGMIAELGRRYRARIYLLLILDADIKNEKEHYNSFLHTYRILQSTITAPIEYRLLANNKLTSADKEFAKGIKKDMLLISAGLAEKKLFMNRPIENMLLKNSQMQLVAVEE